jgi:hypothetical protein
MKVTIKDLYGTPMLVHDIDHVIERSTQYISDSGSRQTRAYHEDIIKKLCDIKAKDQRIVIRDPGHWWPWKRYAVKYFLINNVQLPKQNEQQILRLIKNGKTEGELSFELNNEIITGYWKRV